MASLPVVDSWTFQTRTTDDVFELVAQERTQVIVVGDILYYANQSGSVTALRRQEPYKLWSIKVGAPVLGALSYGRSKIFVGNTRGKLSALHSRDGSVAWEARVQSEWLSPPAVVRDKVCASSSADDVYCFSEKDGHEIWHFSHRGDERMTVRGTASPSVYGDVIYQGFSDGYLAALTLGKGSVVWVKKLRTRNRFYDIDMPVHADEQGVIVATFDGNLVQLDRLTGDTKWIFPVGSHGGFLVEADRIYFSGLNGHFYALDRKSGSAIWKTPFEQGVGLTPVRVGEQLVFTTTNDPVYLLDATTGKILWKRALGAGTFAAAASSPAEGVFYALSNYGNLFAFSIMKDRKCFELENTLGISFALFSSDGLVSCQI
jgi:outer membrane protein assembly factor BamB